MKITTQYKGQTHEFSFDGQDIREALDYAIRHNPEFWEVVRDIAGRYQAELMLKEAKRRKMFKAN